MTDPMSTYEAPDLTLPDVPEDDEVWEDFEPKGPGVRTLRTFIQALVGFLLSVPVALTAVDQAGLDVPDNWIVGATAIGAGLTVVTSAAVNAWDWYFGND